MSIIDRIKAYLLMGLLLSIFPAMFFGAVLFGLPGVCAAILAYWIVLWMIFHQR